MARERIGILARKSSKFLDNVKVYFGSGEHASNPNVGDAYLVYDGAALNLDTPEKIVPFRLGKLRPTGFRSLSDRYELIWVAGQRGRPGLNADIQNSAEATRMIADPDFEVLGTNASSDDVTFYAEGGITFTTDGADGDGVILVPHLDADQSAWSQVKWGTDNEVAWECEITTGSDITNCIIWAGLKLTNTPTTATDNDQAFFRYEDDVNDGKWQAISSINGTDDEHDTGIEVEADTRYHLRIAIDAARVARFYINGSLVEASAALKDATDLIPYIGVEEDGGTDGKVLHIHGQAISRAIG